MSSQRVKTWLGFFLVLGVLFVALGDTFLPEPLKGASYHTRTSINQSLVSIFPSWQPKTNPYRKTNNAVEKLAPQTQ
jgi:hypothetical protein